MDFFPGPARGDDGWLMDYWGYLYDSGLWIFDCFRYDICWYMIGWSSLYFFLMDFLFDGLLLDWFCDGIVVAGIIWMGWWIFYDLMRYDLDEIIFDGFFDDEFLFDDWGWLWFLEDVIWWGSWRFLILEIFFYSVIVIIYGLGIWIFGGGIIFDDWYGWIFFLGFFYWLLDYFYFRGRDFFWCIFMGYDCWDWLFLIFFFWWYSLWWDDGFIWRMRYDFGYCLFWLDYWWWRD